MQYFNLELPIGAVFGLEKLLIRRIMAMSDISFFDILG
jgi:hypothetical protein